MIKANELRIGNKVIVRTAEYTGGRPTGAIITKGIEVFAIIKHPISAPDKRPVIMFKDGDHLNEHSLNENVIPIPLAPEWLERMGFEYEEETGDTYASWYGHNGHIQIDKTEDGFKWVHGEDFRHDFISIEYVHQLQNLFFALTGEELTIKQ